MTGGDFLGTGRAGETAKGSRKLLGVTDLIPLLIVVMVSWVPTNVKFYEIVYFKYVLFIVCALFLKLSEKSIPA